MSIDYSLFAIKIYFFLVFFFIYGGFAYSFSFDGLRIPPPKSILIHPYQFFMFENDESYHSLLVPKASKYSTIYFNNLKVKLGEGTIQDDKSVEIIIVPSKDLENLIKNDQLGVCCNKENLLSGNCQSENTFIKPNIDGLIYFGTHLSNSNYFSNIKRGGAYSLMISNCGSSSNGYIYGELVIKNVYGFLPAIEFMKINLYFFGLVLYAFLAIYWIYKCIRNSKHLINMQYYMIGELLLSFVSSFLWFHYYRQWNLTGSSSKFLFGTSTAINTLKLTIVVILTLIASNGVGISKISINSRRRSIAIFTIGTMYFFNTLFKEYVVYLRSRNASITSSLLLYSILPIGIINGIVFFWVFHELVNLLNKLENEKQTEKLSLYKRFTYILFFSVIIAFTYLLLEIRFYSWDIVERWKYQWIFQDAIPFFFVSVFKLNLLLLWIPKENSKKYLNAAEVPIEVVIELETQELKNITFKNEKDLNYNENMNITQIKDYSYIENLSSSQDPNYGSRISEGLDQSNSPVVSEEINLTDKNRNNLDDYYEKSEVNKENSTHLINR
ncbi:lung seven transmembrane receptor family [Cryptosporidium sp. chipmunk genotype I]|uniref:lung seven transmembrane receptor family n=1 Tax=Cryptosporidium sp. chipmunk genotype I TaxID=1280935 RepID=UPI00351A6350|nr:lung seven transmembrane receptor family [Cryptosporidium sp. chipmunk genotype I]